MSDRKKEKTKSKALYPSGAPLDYGMLSGLVGYHLRRAQAFVFDDFMRNMADERITPGQFGVLTLIRSNPGISQSALSRAVGTRRSTMVAVIDELEERGLAERRLSAHDRRAHALHLTQRGVALMRTLEPKVRRHERRVAGDLSSSEIDQLIALLSRLKKSL